MLVALLPPAGQTRWLLGLRPLAAALVAASPTAPLFQAVLAVAVGVAQWASTQVRQAQAGKATPVVTVAHLGRLTTLAVAVALVALVPIMGLLVVPVVQVWPTQSQVHPSLTQVVVVVVGSTVMRVRVRRAAATVPATTVVSLPPLAPTGWGLVVVAALVAVVPATRAAKAATVW